MCKLIFRKSPSNYVMNLCPGNLHTFERSIQHSHTTLSFPVCNLQLYGSLHSSHRCQTRVYTLATVSVKHDSSSSNSSIGNSSSSRSSSRYSNSNRRAMVVVVVVVKLPRFYLPPRSFAASHRGTMSASTNSVDGDNG